MGLRRGAAISLTVVRRCAAWIVLTLSYGITLLVSAFASVSRGRHWSPTGRIALIGTFHNPNWFLSHVIPLARSGAYEVIVVTDEVLSAPENVRFLCPPRWFSMLAGRALAKFTSLVICALRYRPDVYIGYHIFPAALTALIVGRAAKRPACYQMTAGPIEIHGGGFSNENRVMSWLSRPSRLVERLATSVAARFDLIVVRGSRAKAFLAARGLESKVAVITGSVTPPQHGHARARDYDLVFVGRMTAIKQPLLFVDIVATVKQSIHSIRAAVVGDGPLLESAERRTARLHIERSLDFLGKKEDVMEVLVRSKIFVLTSRSEGLPISMLEAMAAGTVPIVPDVGEVRDIITDGVNGYIVEANNIPQYIKRIFGLLRDNDLWRGQSEAAMEAAARHSGDKRVADQWVRTLQDVISRFPTSACPKGHGLSVESSLVGPEQKGREGADSKENAVNLVGGGGYI